MTIIISSFDERISYSFICKDADNFKKIGEAFYYKYPEYIKTRNFTIKLREINVNESLEDNNI